MISPTWYPVTTWSFLAPFRSPAPPFTSCVPSSFHILSSCILSHLYHFLSGSTETRRLKAGFYSFYLQIEYLSSFLEVAGLWKQPETRVLLVGKKSQAECTLLHSALRNVALALYLAPTGFSFSSHRQPVSGPIERLYGESTAYVIKSWPHTVVPWHSITADAVSTYSLVVLLEE